jgi:hypothetical protein
VGLSKKRLYNSEFRDFPGLFCYFM